MRTHKLPILLLLSLFAGQIVRAQVADSLHRLLKQSDADTTRMVLYGKLALLPGQAMELNLAYLDSAIAIGETVADKNYLGRSWKAKGDIYMGQALPDSAAVCFKEAIGLFEATGNALDFSMTYYSLGNAYSADDKLALALTAFITGEKSAMQNKLSRSAAYNKNGIAVINLQMGNMEEAERYRYEALAISFEVGDPKLTGWIYTGLAQISLAKHEYDSALVQFTHALESYTSGQYLAGIAGAHNNIGVSYSYLEQYDSAIAHYRIAAITKHQYGELNGESIAMTNISMLFVLMKNADSAIYYARRSMEIALMRNSVLQQAETFSVVAEAYAFNNQYDSAYHYQKLYKQYNDSVFNTSLREQISELKTQYDDEQQKQQIALLEQTNKVGELWNYVFASTGIIVFIIAVFTFMRYRSKKRANILLEMQNGQITEQKKEITDSILYAKRIQQALLASASLMKKHIPDHFVLYKPKDIVSGDFYWASAKNNSFWIAVCDSTGHGVPGAFMSLLNTTFLSEAINEKALEHPGEVFDFTRRRLIESLSHTDEQDSGGNDGMDAILLKITDTEVAYCGANGSGILIRNGTVTELASDKMPVGRSPRETIEFSSHKMSIQKGDIIYLFTDGYADQFGGEKGKKFKHKALVQLLAQNSSRPAKEQQEILADSHNKWKGNLEQVDDILIVGLFF